MTTLPVTPLASPRLAAGTIAPIIVSVFAIYLTIGLTLGILPGFMVHDLHASSLLVGLAVGLQSLATLVTRAYSGKITDLKGPKASNYRGIVLIVFAGILYLIASLSSHYTVFALGMVLLARIMHGVSESLAITGALAWGIGLAGVQHSGKVMTWNGIAMYAGIAIGAPVALFIHSHFGAVHVFGLMTILPVLSWLATASLRELVVDGSLVRTPFYKVIGLISQQGLGLAFSSIGFACISSFISLLFSERHWGSSSLAYIAFGSCYILTRLLFSSLPDRFGGYKVAVVSLIVEVAGQLLIGFSSSEAAAIAGCSLTAIGFSLIFPSLGVLAIKKVAPQMRGTALGAYAAFFDLSLGLAGPIAGGIAGLFNYQSIYFFGAVCCVLSIITLLTKGKQ